MQGLRRLLLMPPAAAAGGCNTSNVEPNPRVAALPWPRGNHPVAAPGLRYGGCMLPLPVALRYCTASARAGCLWNVLMLFFEGQRRKCVDEMNVPGESYFSDAREGD